MEKGHTALVFTTRVVHLITTALYLQQHQQARDRCSLGQGGILVPWPFPIC